MPTPHPHDETDSERRNDDDRSYEVNVGDWPHEDKLELPSPACSSTKKETEDADGRD